MNLFGTDGIRNKVGEFPFTTESLEHLGKAIAQWALEKYGSNVGIVIIQDPRYSSDWVKAALTSGLLRYPLALIDGETLPTPAASFLMNFDANFSCSIVISASHNPAQDTGLKIMDRNGKITLQDEERISSLMQSVTDVPYSTMGLVVPYESAYKIYGNIIVSLCKPNFLAGHKIVLDCAQGATYAIAPLIFKELGAECIVINDEPDGYNINKDCGALAPQGLQNAVLEHKAIAGFAFDGDGDRIIAVNKDGIIKDGDDILALLLEHPDFKNTPAVVGTIMSNQGLQRYVEQANKEFIRASVGDKYVMQELRKHKSSLGGEPSGHILLPSAIPTGDGILVALKIMETMILKNDFSFKTFTKFPQTLINKKIKHKKALTEQAIHDAIEKAEQQVPNGRVLVRYSGTEPLLRVMVEDIDPELTKKVAHDLSDQLELLLS